MKLLESGRNDGMVNIKFEDQARICAFAGLNAALPDLEDDLKALKKKVADLADVSDELMLAGDDTGKAFLSTYPSQIIRNWTKGRPQIQDP